MTQRKDPGRKAWPAAAVVALAAMFAQGCSYHSAFIRYDEYSEVALQPDGFEGADLGEITIKEGGAIWKECTDVARGAIWLLVEETRRRGGNAVGDIRWMPKASDRRLERPTCKRRWASFLIWPLVATPVFMAANVEGTAYRVDSLETESAGLYLLPDNANETGRLVESILAETMAPTESTGGRSTEEAAR